MIKQTLQRGFTLIELLVVIAIIGILAAVVLASLNDARDSGSDASIKQSLANLRSQAEIVYNQDNFTYAGVCANQQIQDLQSAIDNTNGAGNYACFDTATDWIAASALVATTSVWCVDSSGYAGFASALPTADGDTCN